ncbi:GNAT family N-acetyltransferase [Jannaschia marina]|uniref:GNAT family N-acetyltransferase n=1 Tax=Jannaschia marina TaxID=2741674 RepID=UPI0015C72679|nr:GNAT family N-acetyltransferase [Jannaschia marina]
MKLVEAIPAHIEQIVEMLQALTDAGKRTRPSDPEFVRDAYVANTDGIRTTLALDDDGRLLGIQVLSRARSDNPYGTPAGWGIIGTHVAPWAARRGVGRALFDETLSAARAAGVPSLDAYIQTANAEGMGYYEAMGFRSWRTDGTATAKRFDLTG